MFKAEIKSDTLKGLVSIISTLMDEVKFTIDPEGMSLKAVDPAHIAMIGLSIGSKAFESYSADSTEIGLDLDKVKSVLKLASSGDIISMEQDADHGRITFKVGNITRRMNLVDTTSMSDPRVPSLSLAAKIGVNVAELQKGFKAAESISDHIALRASPDGFELSCEGDTDSVNLKLAGDGLVSLDAPTAVSSMFPLDYISNIAKAIPADTVVNIELDTNRPVKLVFDIADGNGSVDYLLAPRIEED